MSDETKNSFITVPGQARAGFICTFSAFALWGLMPLYMKAISHVSALEIVASRIIWSIPVALVFLLVAGRTSEIVGVFKSPSKLVAVAACATVISINWGLYVWAITAERTIEAALGYYINPLISVALGMIFLGEKLNRIQGIALALAFIAVSILTCMTGELPWIALILGCPFGVYGLIRKTVDIGPALGFMTEVLILSVVAIPYLYFLAINNELYLGSSPRDTYLLIGCGPITAVPLILFAHGAKRLQLTTVGLLQYIAPSMIFLTGVFLFKEPFTQMQLLAFVLIWLAIALYIWSGIRAHRPY
ncbi:MAG: EamA family transporter RarD [Hyphomicrobiales bacterium]|nr:EamA family transporter RarD [Hyphomicrobiales bacterium]